MKIQAYLWLAGLFVIASGNAFGDLKMTVMVTNSGAQGAGFPASGRYEVSFHPGSARLVRPNGEVVLFDFGRAKVSTLDPKAKTYTERTLQATLTPGTGSTANAQFGRDLGSRTSTMFGAPATHYFIGDQASPMRNPPRARRGQQVSRNPIGSIGTAWVALESRDVRASVRSVAPLVMVGVPSQYVDSVTQQLDRAGDIPLVFDFSSGRSGGRGTLNARVVTVSDKPLEASLFAVPSDYRSTPSAGSSK